MNDTLSVSAGTLSFNGSPATTVTINNINATSVTISGSGDNAGKTWCISSVKVYYTATIENELEISDTQNANVKTFTMVDSEVTISAEFEPNVYTVAGSSTAVFGTAWDTDNEANNMVLNAGVYTLTKEDVTLPVGKIEFKVVTNHSWDNTSYPANNYELNISEAGIYDIEISFDLSQGNNGVSAVATKVGEAVVIPTVSIAGEFNSWSTSANVLSDDGTNHLTCSGTISLTPGWYDFKVVRDGSWLSVGPGEYDEGDKHQMSRRYTTKEGLTTGRKNFLLLVDIAGDYEFVFTYATNDLVISVPNFVRAAANTNYQSLCTPFDATIDGATAYTVGAASESGVTLNPVVGNLEAGHSYIIKPAAVGTITVNFVAEGSITTTPVQPNGTGLRGQLVGNYTYVYNNEPTWKNIFVLLDDDMFHQVVADGSVTITPTHAYLHIEGQEIVPNPGAPGIRIIETATNIENIEGNETAVKFIENGKLFIKKNGVVYDAVGTIVK